VQRKENLRNFSAQIDVGGSAGSTVIKLMHQRGVAAATEVAALTLPNDGTDPDTRAYMAVNFECEPGDRVYHEVTTAPTNGTGLSVSSDAMRRFEGTTQLPVSS